MTCSRLPLHRSLWCFIFLLSCSAIFAQTMIKGLELTESSFEKTMRLVAKDFRYGFRNLKGDLIAEKPRVHASKLTFPGALHTYFLEDENGLLTFRAIFSEFTDEETALELYQKLIIAMKKCSFFHFYLDYNDEVRTDSEYYADFFPERDAPKANPIYNNLIMQIKMEAHRKNKETWRVLLMAFFAKP